jgi:hypothetical protein
LQSNGVKEHSREPDLRMWGGRLLDTFIAGLQPGEKLVEVKWFAFVTDQRTRSRAELKASSTSRHRNFEPSPKLRISTSSATS